MNLWAFRFLLFYIVVLFVQPQNRFHFLIPFHIADISVMFTIGFHILSAFNEKRPLLRLGPLSILCLLLLMFSLLSLYVGKYQLNSNWNPHIDLLSKSILIGLLVEATATTPRRVWAVACTTMLGSLWWVKGGIRLIASDAIYSMDRIMGPAVGLVENPNGFAYQLCVMLVMYVYFYDHLKKWTFKIAFAALILISIFIIFKTGSRTGIVVLLVFAIMFGPRYAIKKPFQTVLVMVAVYFMMGFVGSTNLDRFKSIPQSVVAFFRGEVKNSNELNQDEQSAQERSLKNRDTWGLIKENMIFGVGMYPNEGKYIEDFPFAKGQVHCEILMAGKQMGLFGMGLYLGI